MIRWNCAFIDRPADEFDAAMAFWTVVSGTERSESRGDHGEFVTLHPDGGDPCVRGQRVGGPGGAHLDLDVDDLGAARRRAVDLGAEPVADRGDFCVLRSPSGTVFCLTTGDGERVPPPIAGPGGALSRLDQVCLDIGPAGYDRELEFWAGLTGWELRPSARPEFTRLGVPDRLPVRILLQRKDSEGPATAHLDLACADIEATAAWHETLGARRIAWGAQWLVMRDPTGNRYCLTARDPHTGRVPR
ncbi:VOC family protein [Nocardia blacklockiae]|uniref:VOC family protein n=1 Tax=Nocardia blacklockiae TaxID=480036 RepID=UPI001895DA2A|nr:VOC family protein [Nocardia blacklockiae]MBF6176728.1 VOC family protein [Nocardia blacklockiae]